MKPYPLLTAVGLIHSTKSSRVAHDQGAGVLVVTHDHRALEVFDRHVEMEDGLLLAPVATPHAD
jgi:ABC-type lipoprotein export system ATPase subunit